MTIFESKSIFQGLYGTAYSCKYRSFDVFTSERGTKILKIGTDPKIGILITKLLFGNLMAT